MNLFCIVLRASGSEVGPSRHSGSEVGKKGKRRTIDLLRRHYRAIPDPKYPCVLGILLVSSTSARTHAYTFDIHRVA